MIYKGLYNFGKQERKPLKQINISTVKNGVYVHGKQDTYQIHKKFKILPLAPLGTPWAQTGG
jgi:hypothetical protein